MTRISIGICAFNEQNNIQSLLSNVLYQYLPEGQHLHEVIVVSSGSTDGTDEIVRGFEKLDNRVHLFAEQVRSGKTRAQNVILQKASGDVIVMLSADVMPSQGSLSKLVSSFKGYVGGADSRALVVNPMESITDFASSFAWEIHNETLLDLSKDGRLRHFAGDMFAIKAGVIKLIPEYIVNDDAYIGLALASKGYRVVHNPESIVYILGPRKVSDYIAQRERVLFGHKQLVKTTGHYPTTFETLLIRDPIRAIRIFLRVCSNFPKGEYWKFPFVVSLEIVSIIRSIIGGLMGKDYINWRRIGSTKAPLMDVVKAEL